MIRAGQVKRIDLLLALSANDPNAADLNIICTQEVGSVAKGRVTPNKDLKKGFATLYNQCYQDMRNELNVQSLQNRMTKI